MDSDKNSTIQPLYTSLKELGLSDIEANLYTVSLRLGPTPISKLAEQTGVTRPNVYKVIESLQKYGLASFYGKEKYARNFMVESPTIILDKLKEKKNSIEYLNNAVAGSMPDLLALYQQGGKDTKIKVLKGREQFVKIFLQTAEEAQNDSSIEFFGSAQDLMVMSGWDIEKIWIKSRLKKNVSVKSLVPKESESMLTTNGESELREVRVYGGKLPFTTAFQLFGKKMILWQPKAPLAILIEDEYLIAMFRSIFYALWDSKAI